MIKSRIMRRAGHVVLTGNSRGAYRVLVDRPGERNNLEDLRLDGRIILKCILKQWDGRDGLD
jgi:hypothetical protein